MNASSGMPSCVVCMTLACSLPGSELKSSGFVPRSVDVRNVLLSTIGRISSTYRLTASSRSASVARMVALAPPMFTPSTANL